MTETAPTRHPATRALLAATIGNWFEVFDFILYGYFATQIGRSFFPETDPLARMLATFATYGVGFVIRPVGGAFMGSYGDRQGRRSALVVTMLLMAGATCATGLIPPYSRLGIFAPILLLLCRLVQGFAAGGEWGGAMTFLVEYAPANRRGLFGALQQVSASLSLVSAVLVALGLNAAMSPSALDAWGWRIPFIAGALIAPVGMYLRRRIPDTPEFAAQGHRAPLNPLREAFSVCPTRLLCIFGISIVWVVCAYIYSAFLINYSTELLKLDRGATLTAMLAGSLTSIVFIVTSGWVSDRIGRKPLLIAGALGLLVTSAPIWHWVVAARSELSLFTCFAVSGMFYGTFSGAAPTFFCELLPTRVRYTALSVAYNAALVTFGGFSPLVALWLIRVSGSLVAPAYYVTACAVVSLIFILGAPLGNRISRFY